MKRTYRLWLHSLSGICQNLSVALFGLAFITPNFSTLKDLEDILVLTLDILFGMLFLVLSVEMEQILEYE